MVRIVRDPARSKAWAQVRRASFRIVLSVTALLCTYYLLPARAGSNLPWLLLVLGAFATVVALQVPFIIRSNFPVIRALEALALAIPTFILIFARGYLSASLDNPGAFSETLDHTDALYFTVSTFATVGYGDIIAQSESMKLAVTAQIMLDLVILGVVVRLFTTAARRGLTAQGRS